MIGNNRQGNRVVSEEIQGRVTRKVCLACNREFTGIARECPHDGMVLIPLAQDQLIGTKLADRYHVLSIIGHGGMGVVYKARHELMDRIVAIKMLQSNLVSDSMSVKRFQQEAKAASRLKHPNVITLYDFGVSPTGQPYLVMDFLDGISLSDVIKKDGQVGVDRSIRVFAQACDALFHAHNQGVVHRDLKPGNIMLIENEGERDFVKVVDFGVAKLMPWAGEEAQRLTQTGEVCGSPVYMSPEQCMGQKLDARSDIYSMGVVIYESLTGKLPLFGKTMVDTMSKHISEMPPPFKEIRPDLYIPERLERVVFKSLQKDPDTRHQTMSELRDELSHAIPKPGKSQVIVVQEPLTPVEPKKVVAKDSGQRFPAFFVLIAAVVVVLAAVAGWMIFGRGTPAGKPLAVPSISAPPPIPPAVSPQASPAVAPPISPPVQVVPAPPPVLLVKPPVIPAPAPAPQLSKTTVQHPTVTHHVKHPAPTAAFHSSKAGGGAADPFEALKHQKSY